MRVPVLVFALGLGAAPMMARAADQPVLSPLDVAIANSAHDWSGVYAGVNAGYSWGEFEADTEAALSGDPTFGGDGPLGGFQIGYNKQLDSVVIGVEGDLQAAGIDGSTSYPGGGNSTSTSLDWFSTARGRVGYAFDSTMIYGTAGLAVGELETSVSGAGGGNDSQIVAGLAAGAGVEQALTPNLSLKAEYLYLDLPKEELQTGSSDTNSEWDGHVVRFGANLKF